MLLVSRKLFVMLLIILSCTFLFSQQATLDWKLHDVGKVRQMITNLGSLWPTSYLWADYPSLIYCEFPPNSSEEHIGEGGIWVGAIVNGDSLVSVTTGWGSTQEFFPTDVPWDTIWAVGKEEAVDIPYWPGYTGISDQDFVTRYSDYNITTITNHEPLFVDVIQSSYAWSSPPLDEMIVFDFKVIATRITLKEVYLAYWLDGNVGYCAACRSDYGFGRDDISLYFPDKYLGVAQDLPGGTDGMAISPIGVRIYPPENINPDTLKWTFNWFPGGAVPGRDGLRYADMARGLIMQDQDQALNGSQFMVSFGPFEMQPGDTIHFRVAEVLGEGMDGLMANVNRANWLVENDFQVPSPPPAPPVKVETASHQVTLRWNPGPGEVNPEIYEDTRRADNEEQPFEGYRVYKSTQSATGPWTLLAEFDVPDNQIGANTGLEYEYTDVGLLDNLEYFYAVTAFSKPDTVSDFPSQESPRNATAKRAVPGPRPPETVGKVAVVPNPYRGDIAYHSFNPPWEKPDATRRIWLEQDRRIQFINLPARCEIKIYTVAGDLVFSILHDDPNQGYEDWNLTSLVGQAISSGIYLYTVEDLRNGKVQSGKFVIIK